MDYEKLYKEALERARKLHGGPDDAEIEEIFPELRKKDNERIRKGLISYLKSDMEYKPSQCSQFYDDALAYLEKQKEQKPEHFELKAGKWYICHRAYCCRADHLTVKEGERFMCEKDGVVKGFVIKEPEKYFIECSAPAPMEDEQKERKPAEWSDEDERILNELLDHCNTENATWYNWLKSLRPQPQRHDTYYDIIHSILAMLKDMDFTKITPEHRVSLLNDIRVKCKDADECAAILDEPHWKPSEVQMEWLESAVKLSTDKPHIHGIIISLYEQLKRL